MSTRIATRLALLAAAAASCSVGPNPRSYGPARDPAGTTCTLVAPGLPQPLVGELLAARPTDAVMVINDKVWVIPYRMIRRSDCQHAGPLPFDTSGVLVPFLADPVRLRARYPQGVGDDLLARLLQAYGQTAPLAPEPR